MTHGTYDLVDITKEIPAAVPSVSSKITVDLKNTNSNDSDKTLSNVEEMPDNRDLTEEESDNEAQNLSVILNDTLGSTGGSKSDSQENTPQVNNGNIVENNSNLIQNDDTVNVTMPQSANDFIKLAGSIIVIRQS